MTEFSNILKFYMNEPITEIIVFGFFYNRKEGFELPSPSSTVFYYNVCNLASCDKWPPHWSKHNCEFIELDILFNNYRILEVYVVGHKKLKQMNNFYSTPTEHQEYHWVNYCLKLRES